MTRLRSTVPPLAVLGLLLTGAWTTDVALKRLAIMSWTEVMEASDIPLAETSAGETKMKSGATGYTFDFYAVAARPLFQAGRAQPVAPISEPAPVAAVPADLAPEAEIAVEPPLPPTLSFRGYRNLGKEPEVLLLDTKTGQETWFRAGDRVGNWIVDDLTRTSAHIRSGNMKIAINMFE